MKQYLGIDIGGTYIKIGIVDEHLNIMTQNRIPIDRSGSEPVMETVYRAVDDLLEEASLEAADVEGIGVSSAGCVDKIRGAIAENGGNVPNWSNTEVTGPLSERYGIPAALVNDGNAVALAESAVGAASGSEDVICVAVGTGIGGGIISGGRLIEGSKGFAGEIGHFPTHVGEKLLSEGGRGAYFENRASTSALVRESEKIKAEWDSGQKLFEAAAEGDEKALSLLDKWLDELAYGITGLVHVFNPETVLIGGGVSAQEELLIKPLRDKVLGIVKPDFRDGLEIKAAALGNTAGMIGAVKYFMDSRPAVK